ncbi:hypothetical protein KUTeg_024917 [Tegillarca granosa]|uniref:Protein quiver n=1 Tax=Tegillarca granosa TaxID=220873 RepID=A0ABQ9DYR8_TEGGR|nr:hypothetical protein KUTeg_024917 [Tegillarca granosa]
MDTSWLLVVLISLLSLKECFGIRCYICSYPDNKRCGDQFLMTNQDAVECAGGTCTKKRGYKDHYFNSHTADFHEYQYRYISFSEYVTCKFSRSDLGNYGAKLFHITNANWTFFKISRSHKDFLGI